MEFTKEQLSELICKHTEKENGLHDLMEIMLESLMVCQSAGNICRKKALPETSVTGTVPVVPMVMGGH